MPMKKYVIWGSRNGDFSYDNNSVLNLDNKNFIFLESVKCVQQGMKNWQFHLKPNLG
jgi:hypothetical protein